METFAQILGYIGMVLIVASFFFKNIKMVRIVNIIGSFLSAFFAIALLIISKDINSFLPTAILNVSLIVVNVTMLLKEKLQSK